MITIWNQVIINPHPLKTAIIKVVNHFKTTLFITWITMINMKDLEYSSHQELIFLSDIKSGKTMAGL
jgi:hypothetical protein